MMMQQKHYTALTVQHTGGMHIMLIFNAKLVLLSIWLHSTSDCHLPLKQASN